MSDSAGGLAFALICRPASSTAPARVSLEALPRRFAAVALYGRSGPDQLTGESSPRITVVPLCVGSAATVRRTRPAETCTVKIEGGKAETAAGRGPLVVKFLISQTVELC